MKVSELWLREWVNPSITAQQLADQMTMAGLEIDAVAPVAGPFSGVIVAEVVETNPHPEADRLTLCRVNTGQPDLLSIVCGARNVRAGLKVALAQIGAVLPGNFVIKEAKLRGQLSQGMLCSSSELGMTEKSEGIMELDESAPIGADLRDYLKLDDHVLEVDLTPNRADCFSVRGIARELAALNDLSLVAQKVDPVPPQIDEVRSIRIDAPAGCASYCGRIIRGINPQAETPWWLAERLRRSGLRPLHPVVDITNYVMLELGQPLHAFDLNCLQGGIVVRYAKPDESLQLLDEQVVRLTPKHLVIADAAKPLALAGIMGGLDSAVEADTTDLFLESAWFNPLTMAGLARQLGLCTDSSQRYERGVDYRLQREAIERATQLILSLAGGQAGPIVEVVEQDQLPKRAAIEFNPARVQQLSGLTVGEAEMLRYLSALGMQIKQVSVDKWLVEAPSHRFDLSLDVDLVEEIVRLYGYDKLPSQALTGDMVAGQVNPLESVSQQAASLLQSRGYHQIISYSFVDPLIQEALYPGETAMQLLNPISSELSQMRLGMWPGLIAALIHNAHRQQQSIKLFEQGVIFTQIDGNLVETPVIAGLLYGESGYLNWLEAGRSFDFFDLKGDVQALLHGLHCQTSHFNAKIHPALHPGQSAEISIKDQPAGWIGLLHPRLQDELELSKPVVLFELKLIPLTETQTQRYQPISRFPHIRRDLSFLVDQGVTCQAIEAVVRSQFSEPWLKDLSVYDVYTGTGIPAGKKSLALAMILQNHERTFVDSEINDLIGAIIKSLESKFDIMMRD